MIGRITILTGDYIGYEGEVLQYDKADDTWTVKVFAKESTPWLFGLKEEVDFLFNSKIEAA